MTYTSLKQAIKNNKTIIWNDPDPIPGNNYLVKTILILSNDTALIQYGEDNNLLSEAEVFLNELKVIK